MKFIHLADLHLGKRVCGYSLLEDQKHILREIRKIIQSEKPTAVFLSGDIYDSAQPSGEAVELLDDFLVEISTTGTDVFLLRGNHDSAERIAYGGRLMKAARVYPSPIYDGKFTPITYRDEWGDLDVWMLPYVRPYDVRATLDSEEAQKEINDYPSAIQKAISQMEVKTDRRNVLLAHLFVTGASRSDSEENVGGLDNVDVSVFQKFDYTALGHIHGPQNSFVDSEKNVRVRYCGTPLKYSRSEVKHKKTLTVIDIKQKEKEKLATIEMREIPLIPLREMREVRGTFQELYSEKISKALASSNQDFGEENFDDYVYVTLLDENDVPDAAQKLRTIYNNLMEVSYENSRTKQTFIENDEKRIKERSPLQIFEDFFLEMNGREIFEEEKKIVQEMIEKIWGENK